METITVGEFQIEDLGGNHIVLKHEGREIHVQAEGLRRKTIRVDVYGAANDDEKSDTSCWYDGTNDDRTGAANG